METDYKRIDIKGSMYEESRKQGCLSMLVQKNLCCSYKRVEKLLFDYKKERCRLASFVYPIAKHITGDSNLKRVAIAMEKERFCVDKFKKIYIKIIGQQKQLGQIKRGLFYIVGAIVGIIFLHAPGILIYQHFSSTPENPLYTPLLAISVTVILSSIISIFLIKFSLHIKDIYKRQLRNLTAEDYPKYFATIYDRLQFVRKEGELFLYDIEEGIGAEKVYTLARHIYKANESRVAIYRENPSNPLLANMDGEFQA